MRKNFIIGEYPDPPAGQLKPDLPKWLFWDVVYDKIDWQKEYWYVIDRLLEWGNEAELAELLRYYGRRKVLWVLRRTMGLMDNSIQRACTFFKVKPEELRCYTEKRSNPGHWP